MNNILNPINVELCGGYNYKHFTAIGIGMVQSPVLIRVPVNFIWTIYL